MRRREGGREGGQAYLDYCSQVLDLLCVARIAKVTLAVPVAGKVEAEEGREGGREGGKVEEVSRQKVE